LPTSTPTALLLAEEGTPIPLDLAPITYLNAYQVSGLSTWQVDSLTELIWTPDGRTLVVGGFEGMRLFDVELRTSVIDVGTENPVVSMSFSRGGGYLATGYRFGSEQSGFGGGLEFWRTDTWEPLGLFFGEQRAVSNVAYTPNGRSFTAAFTGSLQDEDSIVFWDTTTWEITRTIKTGPIQSVAFSPNGELIATSPDRYAIKIWRVSNGLPLLTLHTTFPGAVNSLAFSPDGGELATGHYDGTIRIWKSDDGELLHEMQAPGVIESLAYSPGGAVLATGDSYQDNNIRLWDAETGLLLRTLEGHTVAVVSLAFSPEGQFLASGSYDGELRLWGLRP
jgi:WD40 repeat protein